MTIKRVFTFEVGGMSLHRVGEGEVLAEDGLLASIELSNAQLAILCFIDSQAGATDWDIGFALVMEQTTVAKNLEYLLGREAVRSIRHERNLIQQFYLRPLGEALLFDGLRLWRASKAETKSPQSDSREFPGTVFTNPSKTNN